MEVTSSETRIARLVRLARVMEIVTVVGIVLIAGLAVAALCLPEWTRNIVLAKLGTAGTTFQITPLSQTLAAIVFAIPLGVMIYGLVAVRQMFRLFARGEIFTERAARYLQTFAVTVFAQAPLAPLTAAGLSAALSLGNPPGQRAIMIGFSSNDYFALIVGGVLFAVATIMRETTRIADENASFV